MKAYKFISMPLIMLLVISCDNKVSDVNQEKAKQLVETSLNNMVSVKGGAFLMGDFGPYVGEKLPYSPNSDDKFLHKVILNDFKISKFKITYKDYDIYSLSIDREKIKGPLLWLDSYPKMRGAEIPAAVTWQQAKDYCLWLGAVSGHKIDLPTEAQWEYATRAEGKYLAYPTDNGKYEPGRNTASDEQVEAMIGYYMSTYPIGRYPANSLGLYDMGFNGREWVNDWYAADYYESSKGLKDPTGPESGDKKVIRGLTRGDFHTALTMYRQSVKPMPIDVDDYKKNGLRSDFTFRCVMNE